MSAPELPELLEEFRDDLLRFAQSHAGRLVRYESPEDLLQGIHVRALERGGEFEYRGREPFLAWLYSVARSYITDRHVYWAALKRRPAALLRLTWGDSSSGVPEPIATATGPSTFADRREQLSLAVRALALLLPRDQELVQGSSEGLSIAELAEHLEISYDAAERARLRALDRFRKAYRLITGA